MNNHYPPKRSIAAFSGIAAISLLSINIAHAFPSSNIPTNNLVKGYDRTPAAETCSIDLMPTPPAALQESIPFFVPGEHRLSLDLRMFAQGKDPMASLNMAAAYYAAGNTAKGNAFADIAVTGRKSFGKFMDLKIKDEDLTQYIVSKLKTPYGNLTPDNAATHAARALDRAYKVANALHYPALRQVYDLGWIAVSGEDDSPYRPVNAHATQFNQYDLAVAVPRSGGKSDLTVHTRYFVAGDEKDGNAWAQMVEQWGGMHPRFVLGVGEDGASTFTPRIDPNAEVYIYIHGMDSRAEEAEQMAEAFQKRAKEDGKKYVVISLDLPTSGYADQINHFSISSLEDVGHPKDAPFPTSFDANGTHNVPVLNFIENFLVNFVTTLDEKNLLDKAQVKAFMGGSLGGNMALRIGRRHDIPWLPSTVAWSAASVWDSFADGVDFAGKKATLRSLWFKAGGDPANAPGNEVLADRNAWFTDAFDTKIAVLPIDLGFNVISPQGPVMWYSSNWPCKDKAIKQDRRERQETYNANFRVWHYRLALEQLVYSHRTVVSSLAPSGDPPQPGKPAKPLYQWNDQRPLLLACGADDNFNYASICDATTSMSAGMFGTRGRFRRLNGIGHSIHNEVPSYWTNQILDFVHADGQW
ncbi:hypothetical protein [Parachitinimonas caeni]|uniref:Alpha/beta hydrolase n=1 Tax=Parachitinimonas caeni TaxID=3031301 RepID=A0ABT7DS78_9NEIS|nr:hypothetical protein [Parachitinimonas caeni]MDK2122819.1 hypothetical protein [Parachitinimonas caeni]